MKDLVIVGASGCGREVLQWVKDINQVSPSWNIKGFIDDNLNALDGYACDFQVIGRICEWKPTENEEFALALANPQTKVKIATSLKSRGAKFTSIIHPTARICEFTEYGEGIIMYPHLSIGPNCSIGDFVTILSSGIGHDCVIGDYATISSYCGISGHVHIGKHVYLGTGCVIPPSKTIGDDALVGMGSVILHNVKQGTKVFGNPAKVVDV